MTTPKTSSSADPTVQVNRRLTRVASPVPRLARLYLLLSSSALSAADPVAEPIHVDLRLRTGGAVGGKLLDFDESGIVIMRGAIPFVFTWAEQEPRSAYVARKKILDTVRGGPDGWTADDYFSLGQLALAFDRNDLAASNFRAAVELDPGYQTRTDQAFRLFRERRNPSPAIRPTTPFRTVKPDEVEAKPPAGTVPGPAELPALPAVDEVPADISAQVLEIYRAWGETARKAVSKSIVLIETEHFLIWTDWSKRQHPRLAEWCESMYAALLAQFELDPVRPVFLAKCPIFAFRAKPRFREFARLFDGFDARNSVGYTRSIEANGHVHVVLLRVGDTETDFDQFAATLVHEGTHAFLHRLYSTRLIPHWVNEGLAEWTAERVLGDRSFTRESADLLARQFVRLGWPIGSLLTSVGPIDVQQYPLAHSVVAHLAESDPPAFRAFIRGLKDGRSTADALAAAYGGLTLTELESRWRAAFAPSQP